MLALVLMFGVFITIYVCVRLYARKLRGTGTAPRLMVVLGSGGHTAEMLKLLDQMDRTKYRPRVYVVAATDAMSGTKAIRQEQELVGDKGAKDYSVAVIPRSREVGQSYATSVLTTLYSLAAAAGMVLKQQPDLLLVNGPGTCIPVCTAAFVFRWLGYMKTRIVYVESIARVRRLSLSGKILYHSRMADVVFVQWQELQQLFPRSVFAGSLY